MSEVFGISDIMRTMGMGDGRRSPPTEKETRFRDALNAHNQTQPGATAPGGLPQMPPGVATGGPLQAALAQRQMQGQQAPAPGGGVMGMQLLPQMRR